MKRNVRKGIVAVLMGVGAVCLIAAIALAGYNIWDEQRAEKSVSIDAEILVESIPEKQEEEQLLVPEVQVVMPTREVDNRYYVGILDVPAVDRSLPVQSTWSENNLKQSPCLYKGTVYGGMIIAGHNYRSHFSPFKNLVEGDKVFFTDVDGNCWHYTVSAIEIIKGDDVAAMEAGEWDLTLFTCTYGGQNRHTIRCTMEIDVIP